MEEDSTDEVGDSLESPDVASSVSSRSSWFVEDQLSREEDRVRVRSTNEAGRKRTGRSVWAREWESDPSPVLPLEVSARRSEAHSRLDSRGKDDGNTHRSKGFLLMLYIHTLNDAPIEAEFHIN